MRQSAVHVFYAYSFRGWGPTETCYRICSHWPGQGLPVRVYSSACLRDDPAGIMAPGLPRAVPRRLAGLMTSRPGWNTALQRHGERRGLARVGPGDLCFFWPGATREGLAEARDRGARIVLEFINTHTGYARRILDAECDRVGVPRYDNFTPELMAEDPMRLPFADAVFAPGPFVGASVREMAEGAAPRILETSYGTYLPAEPPPRRDRRPADRRLKFLFMGSIGLRKGAHTLLEAWRRAKLPAELWLAGRIEPHMQAHLMGPLPEGVTLLGHVSDIARVYREADVFVFPSLEEGGPQVTYEAAAQGLPLVVTPMGGGRIARDRETALVVPPADPDALAAALTRLHEDAELRDALGRQALADAADYAWDRVADGRRRALLEMPEGGRPTA